MRFIGSCTNQVVLGVRVANGSIHLHGFRNGRLRAVYSEARKEKIRKDRKGSTANQA